MICKLLGFVMLVILGTGCAPTLKITCMDKMGPDALVWSHTVAESRSMDDGDVVVFWRCDGKKWVKETK